MSFSTRTPSAASANPQTVQHRHAKTVQIHFLIDAVNTIYSPSTRILNVLFSYPELGRMERDFPLNSLMFRSAALHAHDGLTNRRQPLLFPSTHGFP